jgi:hypothetical protein
LSVERAVVTDPAAPTPEPECDDLGRGHHVWDDENPDDDARCRCLALRWGQAKNHAVPAVGRAAELSAAALADWLREQARVRGLGASFVEDDEMEAEMIEDSEMLLRAATALDELAALATIVRSYSTTESGAAYTQELEARAEAAEAMLNATLAQPVHLENRELEAENTRLRGLNSGLTRDFNAMLVEQSKQRNRAEAAEAENTRLRAALERWKDHFEEFAGPNQARAEIVRLAESEARLRAALEPFAQDAEAFDNAEGTYGDEPVFERRSSEHHWRFRIADVRRARDALAAAPNEDA